MSVDTALLDAPDPCDRCVCLRAMPRTAYCDHASQAQGRVIGCKEALRTYVEGTSCRHFESPTFELFDMAFAGEAMPEAEPNCPTEVYATIPMDAAMLGYLVLGTSLEMYVMTPDGPRKIVIKGVP